MFSQEMSLVPYILCITMRPGALERDIDISLDAER